MCKKQALCQTEAVVKPAPSRTGEPYCILRGAKKPDAFASGFDFWLIGVFHFNFINHILRNSFAVTNHENTQCTYYEGNRTVIEQR